MPSKIHSYPKILMTDRKELRKWLKENYDKSEGIWIVHYKKNSGKKALEYNDLVEELLCFGWIDGQVKGIDEEKTSSLVTPRRPKSNWSGPNKIRIKKLIKEGLMTEAGLVKIEQAKKDGSWNNIDSPESILPPKDLLKALKANPKAKENFEKFPPSTKKMTYQWINIAKAEETKLRRIEKAIKLAEENKRIV